MRIPAFVFPLLALLGIDVHAALPSAAERTTDVLVYGGTPAGIAAALAAGRAERDVLLVEPYRWVGGMVTNGLAHSDTRTLEGITGTFRTLTQRAELHYREKFGPVSTQVRDAFHGTQSEPHVYLLVFRQMLAEVPRIRVVRQHQLVDVELSGDRQRISVARFSGGEDNPLVVHAKIYIDATYEGDLMAQARVPFRVGRESRDEYGESLAPAVADGQVQGYNFRFSMTQDPENRVRPQAPPGYRREDFLPLLPLLETGRLKSVFCNPSGGIYKAQVPQCPNAKFDINDVSHGLLRLSLPDVNDAWPDGDAATRAHIYREHVRHNQGLLYFLQNDKDVPERFQREARQWGWCQDEFTENEHVPEQLYVREARRMVGKYVFTEHDTDPAPADTRCRFQLNAIAQGDYGLNCHGTGHEGPRIGGRHTGEFYKRVAPYQVPYGVIVPRNVENLLVPVACSASHVGFCGLRLESIWTSLGDAAGFAAHEAIRSDVVVQDVDVEAVRRQLHRADCATIYVSDVTPASPHFVAVQWWGSHGGLHGLSPPLAEHGQRGENISGQYYEAFPSHAAELEKALDASLQERWIQLAASMEIRDGGLQLAETRGTFIHRAYDLYQTTLAQGR